MGVINNPATDNPSEVVGNFPNYLKNNHVIKNESTKNNSSNTESNNFLRVFSVEKLKQIVHLSEFGNNEEINEIFECLRSYGFVLLDPTASSSSKFEVTISNSYKLEPVEHDNAKHKTTTVMLHDVITFFDRACANLPESRQNNTSPTNNISNRTINNNEKPDSDLKRNSNVDNKDVAETNNTTSTTRVPKFTCKSGFTQKIIDNCVTASFLDLKNTEIGLRPKVLELNPLWEFMEEISILVLDAIGRYLLAAADEDVLKSDIIDTKVEPTNDSPLNYTASDCNLRNKTTGLYNLHDNFTHIMDEFYTTNEMRGIASSVLRCSRYELNNEYKNDTDNVECSGAVTNNNIDKVVFPGHTDATFVTVSYAQPGLEFLIEGRGWCPIEEFIPEKCEGDSLISASNEQVSDLSTNQNAQYSYTNKLLCLFVGDFLEIISSGYFKAAAHRICFRNSNKSKNNNTTTHGSVKLEDDEDKLLLEQNSKNTTAAVNHENNSHNQTNNATNSKNNSLLVRDNVTFLLRPDDKKIWDPSKKFNINNQLFSGSNKTYCNDDTAQEIENESHEKISVRNLRKYLDLKGKMKDYD